MPCDAGRNAGKLAELSRRTGVNIVAPTGLHHERFYGPVHWSHLVRVADLALSSSSMSPTESMSSTIPGRSSAGRHTERAS